MKIRLMLAVCLLLAYSCTTDETSIDVAEDAQRAPIVHTADNAVSGQLLVKFNPDSTPDIAPNTQASRSGIAAFDAIATRAASLQMRRLIPYNEPYEASLQESGMNRWYLLEFDENTDLRTLAESIAKCGAADVVEFSVRLKLQNTPIDRSKMACSASAELAAKAAQADTRATALFDDPYLGYQWHYINTAQSSVATKIVAGADIGVEEVWRSCTTGDESVIVAVVDEGVQAAHPDLQANMWVNSGEIAGNGIDDDGNGYVDDVNGYNFAYNQSKITFDEYVDDNNCDVGHGTHVAGTIAAVNNNSTGVSGIAGGNGNGGVKIMSCQIFAAKDSASSADCAKAITYAAQNGAVILQCSWGYDAGDFKNDSAFVSSDSVEKNAIDYFEQYAGNDTITGGVAIFAAGNETTAMAGYPGAYHDYISVAAMAPDYTATYYTNYNLGVNITAPGGDVYQDMTSSNKSGSYEPSVLSTLPTTFTDTDLWPEVYKQGYGYMQGTSMACPHVSGVAALAVSYAKKLGKHLTAQQLRTLLITSADDINSYCTGTGYYYNDYDNFTSYQKSTYKNKMGAGLLNAYRVMMQIKGTPCLTVNKLNTQVSLSLNEYFGDQSSTLTYTAASMADADKTRLGVVTCTASNGRLLFKCTKAGSALVKVTAVVGGTVVGGSSSVGGMAVEREFAVVVRPTLGSNGYWL